MRVSNPREAIKEIDRPEFYGQIPAEFFSEALKMEPRHVAKLLLLDGSNLGQAFPMVV
ncbi:MAG: hypothetical protein P4M11_13970 [Candidatus Pacebacteria bacterium]|nr:hypothetical protein [Candidatus Paceibacterota bacterium]